MKNSTIKNIVLSTLLISPYLLTSSAHAGWPVSVIADLPGQINQITNYAQMLTDYATLIEQLDQMKQQYDQMELDYKSTTGSRNLGEILNNPAFKNYLPDNWQEIQRNVRNNGYEGLSGTAKALRNASKIFDACEYITDYQEKRNCAARAVKPAQDQAFATDAYKKSAERVTQIESLMKQINQTSDPKAIAELNARIQAEQAMIQNEQTKLALYQSAANAEQALLEQQRHELNKKTWSSRQYGTDIPAFKIGG